MRFLPPTDQKCAESSTFWQFNFFYYRPPGKFWFTHLGEIVEMLYQELNIYTYYIYIYDALHNRYGFSISVQHGIDCTTFHSFFSWKVWKKMFFKIFEGCQVCDWLGKSIIMLRFMDLRWPRVFRRSNVSLVYYCLAQSFSQLHNEIHFFSHSNYCSHISVVGAQITSNFTVCSTVYLG